MIHFSPFFPLARSKNLEKTIILNMIFVSSSHNFLKYFILPFPSSYETQVGLVRNAWSDIFVLGMSQCSSAMNLQDVLGAIVSHLQTSVAQEKLTAQRVKQVTTTICKVQEYVKGMSKMNIDDHEFAYLKTIALFNAGEFFFLNAREF